MYSELDNKRFLVYAVPPPKQFPEIQEELIRIGGTTPDGRPRLFLEWGGTARRFFGIHKVAKYAATQVKEKIGFAFTFLPDNPLDELMIKRFGMYHEVITNGPLDSLPVELLFRQDGSPRIPGIIEAYVDYPYPNWYITDWMSPQKMVAGGWHELYGPEPREGYYAPIFRIHDPRPEMAAIGFYRDPDGLDLDMARKYQHEKESDTMDMGRHFDEPLDGDDANILNGWIVKAIKHAREEAKQVRIQEYAEELEKIIEEERQGPKASVVVPGV